MSAMMGSANGRWNSGTMRSSHGYTLVRVGKDHPLADKRGYAYEHMLVWAAAGRELKPGHLIHHDNDDKSDNRLSNLVQITRAEHSRLHAAERCRAADTGRFLSAGHGHGFVVGNPPEEPSDKTAWVARDGVAQ